LSSAAPFATADTCTPEPAAGGDVAELLAGECAGRALREFDPAVVVGGEGAFGVGGGLLYELELRGQVLDLVGELCVGGVVAVRGAAQAGHETHEPAFLLLLVDGRE
jgi:hypothetical protein